MLIKPTAEICYRDTGVLMHVQVLDYRDNVYQAPVFGIHMAKALNECKRNGKNYMVFFGEPQN